MTRVTIEGLPELRAKFSELADKGQKQVLRGAIAEGAKVVVKEAKRLVQVDRGDLQKAIKQSTRTSSGRTTAQRTEATIGFEKDEYYGKFVELGTSEMPAEPFLRPALEGKAQEVLDTIGKGFKKHIDRVAAKSARG